MLQTEDRVPINDLVGSGQSNDSWLRCQSKESEISVLELPMVANNILNSPT